MLTRLIGIVLAIFLLGGCSSMSVLAKVPVPLPRQPALTECPQPPPIEAKIIDVEAVGKHIMMTLVDAIALRDWIYESLAYDTSNMVELMGYIEKLENRLNAIGGDN